MNENNEFCVKNASINMDLFMNDLPGNQFLLSVCFL